MLALTGCFIALLYVTGLRADRGVATLTEPGNPTDRSVSYRTGQPGSVSGWSTNPGSVSVLYRGHDAPYWAAKFRHRTRQLQHARRAVHAVIRPGYGKSWLERAFLCIHSYEGSWTDTGAPFWGGLQMDSNFMGHYGDWALKAFGTADKWPVSVQISTAIQAKVSGRGFYPWPNTARYCGLL